MKRLNTKTKAESSKKDAVMIKKNSSILEEKFGSLGKSEIQKIYKTKEFLTAYETDKTNFVTSSTVLSKLGPNQLKRLDLRAGSIGIGRSDFFRKFFNSWLYRTLFGATLLSGVYFAGSASLFSPKAPDKEKAEVVEEQKKEEKKEEKKEAKNQGGVVPANSNDQNKNYGKSTAPTKPFSFEKNY